MPFVLSATRLQVEIVDPDFLQIDVGKADEAIDERIIQQADQMIAAARAVRVVDGLDHFVAVGQAHAEIEGMAPDRLEHFLGGHFDDPGQAADLGVERGLPEIAAGEQGQDAGNDADHHEDDHRDGSYGQGFNAHEVGVGMPWWIGGHVAWRVPSP